MEKGRSRGDFLRGVPEFLVFAMIWRELGMISMNGDG